MENRFYQKSNAYINFADKKWMSSEEDQIGLEKFEQTSLDYNLEEQEPYNEYIRMLKNNNEVITMALRKAEDLIIEYKQDNEYLKERNAALEK